MNGDEKWDDQPNFSYYDSDIVAHMFCALQMREISKSQLTIYCTDLDPKNWTTISYNTFWHPCPCEGIRNLMVIFRKSADAL